MYTIYILESLKSGKYYVGHTENLENRILRHNAGQVISTRNKDPWKVSYSENFTSKIDANRRELEIKSKKSSIYTQAQIEKVN